MSTSPRAYTAPASSHQKASGGAAWIAPKTSPHTAGRWIGCLFAAGISRASGSEDASGSGPRLDGEAEHHAALVVLGDVAVGHPQAGIADVEQDVDRLPGGHQHGVLPYQAWLDDSVAAEDQEAAGAVDVERMMHRMVSGHLVEQPDLDLVSDVESPVDLRVPCARLA